MGAMHHPRIKIDPKVMTGKPVIRGTRITVEVILRWLSDGRTFEELLEAYPHPKEADLKAALIFAAEAVNHAKVEAAE